MTDLRDLLHRLAVPRLVGSVSLAHVMAVLKAEAQARGFVVEEQRLAASPDALVAVAWAGAVVAASGLGVVVDAVIGAPGGIAAGVVAWSGVALVLVAVRPLRRFLVTSLGMLPVTGAVNLIATRGGASLPPAVWLVAHYDAKGQPMSMATRIIAAALTGVGGTTLGALAILWRTGADIAGATWLAAALPALVGGALLARNASFRDSPGALDNASGLLTVLRVIDRLPPDARVGLLWPDAEEWGLLGAKAVTRARPELFHGAAVINFDGIDHRGPTFALLHRPGPVTAAVAGALGARRAGWLPVVVDGAALAPAARECITIMRGDWHTMRVVHTARDTPERLELSGVEAVAERVAAVLASVLAN